MSKPGSNSRTFIFGLLVGAAAGAIAGILLAPDKGSETRRKVSEKARELKDSLPDQLETLKARIEQKLNEIKSSIRETEKL